MKGEREQAHHTAGMQVEAAIAICLKLTTEVSLWLTGE